MDLLDDKLKSIKKKVDNIEKKIFNGVDFIYNKDNILLHKEYYELKKIISIYDDYLTELHNLKEANVMLSDEKDVEMTGLINEEKKTITKKLNNFKKKLSILLINNHSNNNKNAIVELRAGTGGDEATIFVNDILRMYVMYFKINKWKYSIINSQPNIGNGYKEIILQVQGDNVYNYLQFESGVHRVQRIPKTESQGRLHTSAVSVVVLPEIQSVNIKIKTEDIKRETFRSSGAGGQNVNKIESAVRLTHIPTKLVVECQEERSQHKNFEKAITVLKSKLYNLELNRLLSNRANKRKTLVSTGDRSAKIRTYNYPQGRVTDHRIKKTIYNLENFLNGNIQNMIDSLMIYFNKQNQENNK
jgi:peptide chain release factor 1